MTARSGQPWNIAPARPGAGRVMVIWRYFQEFTQIGFVNDCLFTPVHVNAL